MFLLGKRTKRPPESFSGVVLIPTLTVRTMEEYSSCPYLLMSVSIRIQESSWCPPEPPMVMLVGLI